MEEQVTIDVTYHVVVSGDEEKTASQKAALVMENISGQANAVRGQFDTGVELTGTATSSDPEADEVEL